MKTKILRPLVALVGALSFSGIANAQQSGTATEAKALLGKAVAAVKADQAAALAKFDDPTGGFKDRDLYVFCGDLKTGKSLNGPLKGTDLKTVKDPTGKAFGQEMLDKAKDGEVTTVDYMFPKPGTTTPAAKEAFIEGIGTIYCGVGYYK
jgi:signal transduction histidine kinase